VEKPKLESTEPLQAAMQSVLNLNAVNHSTLYAPSFRNGASGRQGNWRDAIPIDQVNRSIKSVSREVGRQWQRMDNDAKISLSFEEGEEEGDTLIIEDDLPSLDQGTSATSSSEPRTADGDDENDRAWSHWTRDEVSIAPSPVQPCVDAGHSVELFNLDDDFQINIQNLGENTESRLLAVAANVPTAKLVSYGTSPDIASTSDSSQTKSVTGKKTKRHRK